MKNLTSFLLLLIVLIQFSSCWDNKLCLKIDFKHGIIELEERGVNITSIQILDSCNNYQNIFALTLKKEKEGLSKIRMKKISENSYDIYGEYLLLDSINCNIVEVNIKARKAGKERYYSFSKRLKFNTNKTFIICSDMY